MAVLNSITRIKCAGLLALLVVLGAATLGEAEGWLGLNKPVFKGKVIDAETKAPIEGAVVVVIWTRDFKTFAGGKAFFEDAQEAITDKEGIFTIPGIVRLPSLNPLVWRNPPDFFIWKPGYGFFPGHQIYPPRHVQAEWMDFFSGELGSPMQAIIYHPSPSPRGMESVEVRRGIVELPRLKTKKERMEMWKKEGAPIPRSLPTRLKYENPTEFNRKFRNYVKLWNEESLYLFGE